MFKEKNESLPEGSISVKDAIKRNNITAADINNHYGLFEEFDTFLIEYINTEVKYEGYIRQQNDEIERSQKSEKISIPEDFDYNKIKGLRLEARQVLSKIRPINIGQAKRIMGVSPADISVLIIMVKAHKKAK